MADPTYQPLTYRTSGGDKMVVASGGVIDIESGGEFQIAGTAVTATAAEINAIAGGGLSAAELGFLDTATAGTVVASKAVVVGTKKDIDFIQFGSAATSVALLHGAGTSSTQETTATADKNFLGYWVESTAATGDCRGMYLRTYFGGAGSGEALRAYATINFAGAAAVGGTINGAHISLSVAASSTVSGQASGARITLEYATDTRTTDTNVSALLLDSNIGANNTVHAKNAFIRVTDLGTVKLEKLLRLPTVASAGILATQTAVAISHSIRCVDDAGTVFYIMCTTDASNRAGGA